jgi:hypothetical protein
MRAHGPATLPVREHERMVPEAFSVNVDSELQFHF